jgi:serine phosphatase RsbU (regulator of sigma subunit)
MFSNRGQLIGILYATKSREYNFDIDDVTLLEGIANQAAIAYENVTLLEESIERGRLEQELKIAREVQLNLLPQVIPKVVNFEIDAFCRTAYEVGGDYYDFFTYADGKTGFIIGDVSGKGTSAALYMAEFKGIIQTLAKIHKTPNSLAIATNDIIYPHIERRSFISAIFGKINEKKNSISFSRAGHPHPVLHSENNGMPNFMHR